MPKEQEITVDDIPRPRVPYAENFSKLSDDLVDDTFKRLDAGEVGHVEAIGLTSLAAALQMCLDGSMDKSKAQHLLMTLAAKKTPDPVQKIEETRRVDMTVLIDSLISRNPLIMKATLENAEQARLNVANRVRQDDLSLAVKTKEEEFDISNVLDADYTPVDDLEIIKEN